MISPKNSYFLLILIVVFCGIPQTVLSFTDICHSHPDPALKTITIDGTVPTQTLTTCRQLFKVDFTTPNANYLRFQVKFTNLAANPTFTPYFIEKMAPFGSTISVYTNAATVTANSKLSTNADYDDQNALINEKDYHYIIFEQDKIQPNTELYFAIYNLNTKSGSNTGLSVSYEIELKSDNDYPCPQGCDSHGKCSQTLNRCICDPGFFDSDCSVEAKEITLDNFSEQELEAQKWTYFYFNVNKFLHDMLLTFEKEQGIVDYSFLFDRAKISFKLANDIDSDGKYTLYKNELHGAMKVESGDISDLSGYVLVVGAYNEEDTPISASIKIEDYGKQSTIRNIAVYTSLIISLGVLTLWAIVTMVKYKYHTRITNALQIFRTEREEEKTLSKADMNTFFPKTKFRDLNSTFNQTLCSVCLEDFELEAGCRQLYCEHIYHSNCIEAWLTSHYNCPNCKKEMTKLAIEEFHKNKNKRDENRSLLQRSPDLRNEVPEEANSQTQNVIRLDAEPMEIRKSMKEVDEIFAGQDLTHTPPVNRRIQLELEISSDKFRSNHKIDTETPVKMHIDSPILDGNRKVEEFRRRMPTRIGTAGSHMQNSPQIQSMKSGLPESKPHLTEEYSFHEAS